MSISGLAEYPAPISHNRYLAAADVKNASEFAQFAQQNLGTPWATKKDMVLLQKRSNEFFSHYPHCGWDTLCRVVMWAKRKRKRFAYVWQTVDAFRWAWQDGAIPELERSRDDAVEDRIDDALTIETNDVWRTALIGTENRNQRRELVEQWEQERKPRLLAERVQ